VQSLSYFKYNRLRHRPIKSLSPLSSNYNLWKTTLLVIDNKLYRQRHQLKQYLWWSLQGIKIYLLQQPDGAFLSASRTRWVGPCGSAPDPSITRRFFTSVAIVRKAFSTLTSCFAEVSKKCMLYSFASVSPSSKDTC